MPIPPNPKGNGLKPENYWKPGQSGNPGGRRAEKPFIDAVRKALKAGNYEDLRKIAEKLIKLAVAGKPWAIQLLCERLDGKTPQEIKVTRDVREMSIDDILGELAEVRAIAAGIGSEEPSSGEPDSLH